LITHFTYRNLTKELRGGPKFDEEQVVEEAPEAPEQDDLFGSDTDDEADDRSLPDDEDAGDADFEPKAAAAPPPTDLKSKLALLAQKKKREAVRVRGVHCT
jgi:hypothetical protein